MAIFGANSSSIPSTPIDMSARKQAVMSSIREDIALQNAQELMNKANEKCFLKCVTKPGASLASSEETCLARCLDRYMEAFDIVSKTYIARLGRERSERQASQISAS